MAVLVRHRAHRLGKAAPRLDGAQAHCLDMRFYGSAMRYPHVEGAFRDSVIADEAQCHKVLPSLTAGEAAMAEPLAVCLHAMNRAVP